MRCPFLREAQVRYCQASPFKKMIVQTPDQDIPERCSSTDYINCPSARQQQELQPGRAHCPFLQESLVQYCSAASVTKYIPYSESVLSRCGNESHRYCELYLALANPRGTDASATPDSGSSEKLSVGEDLVEGIRVPRWLSYSANHLWLDMSTDGYCHIGADSFLSRVLGSVDRITYLAARGVTRPTVILTVRGVDLQLAFPNPILVTRSNSYLRANPGKLVSDPYGLGWLFEGAPLEAGTDEPKGVSHRLIPGEAAPSWIRDEVRRIASFVHERVAMTDPQGQRLMADGGSFAPGFVQHLSREEILGLFNDFFSPYASWRS